MKSALTLVFVALSAISLSVSSRAVAQQSMPSTGPTIETMQQQGPAGLPGIATNGGLPTGGSLTPGQAASQPVPPPAAAEPVPTPAANAPVDTNMLIDNGLMWDNGGMPDCCTICGGGCCAPADWYMEQEIRILNRSRPRDVGIGFTAPATVPDRTLADQVLNSRTATPNISAVWGMTFGHYFARDTLNRDHFIEFSFWGLNNWRDEASFAGHRLSVFNSLGQKTSEQGNLYSGYSITTALSSSNTELFVLNGSNVLGFDRADQQTTFYQSSTNNVEINGRISPRNQEDRLVLHPNGKWRRECQPGMYVSYLYGLRFLQINETFRFHSQGRIDTFDPTTGALIDTREDTGDYGIVTRNNILGLQVGMDMTWRHCRWSWGLRSRIGPCVNFADQDSNISAVSSDATITPWERRLAGSKHVASLIGEVGIEGSYKFRPNLVGHAMYDMTWVSGVALAPEQLQFNTEPSNRVNTNGLAYFHGISLSLEWLW